MHFLNDPFSLTFWLVWALFLIWQNYAFTFVSRARNSGSLKRHMIAALQSNGVWFLQTLFVFGAFKSILDGKFGYKMTAFAALYYTAFTMVGSIWAHFRSLKKEAGMAAVGANKKYAQIPVEEWANFKADFTGVDNTALRAEAAIQKLTGDFGRVKQLAEQAYDISVGIVPNSGIAASKVAGAPVVTGMHGTITEENLAAKR